MKIVLMHLDFLLVRNVGEITFFDTSLQETEQMYLHKNTQTSSAFQSIIQKDYLFKPCSGMLMDTIFPPSR